MWGPKWSGMRWGHAVSKDLLAWTHLPVAINHWDGAYYDCPPWPAIFSGSTTMVNGVDPLVLYSVPCQHWVNGAVPKNRSDPLLTHWTKLGPIFNASQSVTKGDGKAAGGQDWGTTFRDPTSVWQENGESFVAMACMNGTCLFKNDKNLTGAWESSGWFHHVDASGAWECPDVFKLPLPSAKKSSAEGKGKGKGANQEAAYTYVLKANTAQGSACVGDSPNNWWATGSFTGSVANAAGAPAGFTPNSKEICGDHFDGIGNHFDYSGLVYASKSFYDEGKGRQVLTSWVKEMVPQNMNVTWSGMGGLPRTLSIDPEDHTFVRSYPIEELATLRRSKHSISAFGAVVDFPEPKFDLDASFAITQAPAQAQGRAQRQAQRQAEVTVSVHLGNSEIDIVVAVHANGSAILQVNGEYIAAPFVVSKSKLDLRVVLDHTILEVFAQGGRVAHTSRVYDTSMGKVNTSVSLKDSSSSSTSSITAITGAGNANLTTDLNLTSSKRSKITGAFAVDVDDGDGKATASASAISIVSCDVYEMADAVPDPELERLAAAAAAAAVE